MANNKIHWHNVDMFRKIAKLQGADLDRNTAYHITLFSGIINPNGSLTEDGKDLDSIKIASITRKQNVPVNDDTNLLKDIPYREALADIPQSYLDAISQQDS